MRQSGTARALIRRSGVSARDWARALGCTRSAMFKLLANHPKMQQGPLMRRLQTLLDDLRDGRAWWDRDRSIHVHGSPRHLLVRERKPEPPPVWKPGAVMRIDPLNLKLTLAPIGGWPADPAEQSPPVPVRDPWPVVKPWNPWSGMTVRSYGLANDAAPDDPGPEKSRRARGQDSTLDPPRSTFPRLPMRRG